MSGKIVFMLEDTPQAGGWFRSYVPIGGELDPTNEAINFLVFKDTVNGKKYKLQITNGVIEVVEVT